ncbi:ABC transporter ATP-binding protein [Romboutsia timonensis]|uniref:ABC transporter ATP-binding protein n=1 Tax=Romboutsia timonensis TaxID=1776391 RepID=UPI002A822657|nr:ABC transporter ATP-binding protein [Romboutsia timonensis]MDY3958981.1 ABC transporter ATP-binding protein [Romboutsia timonensis]
MKILETIDLTKKYGKGDIEVVALDKVNLTINKGEFIAIIGPSGSGKSTLLHLLGGLEKPSKGFVKIEEQNISDMHENKLARYRRKNIGFIFQQYNLIPVLDVRENIKMPLMLDKASIDEKYIDDIVNFLGLKEIEKHLPNQLSGGQQQRVAIGRALAPKPSIILADEPTGNLDTKTTEEVLKLLKDSIKKYNQTLVMITHNEEIARMADRVIYIKDGKLI